MKGHNTPPSVEVANARQQQRGQEGQTRSGAVPGTTPVGEGKSLGPIPRRDHQNLRKTMCRDGRIAATECRKKVPQSRPIPQGKRRSQGVRGVSRSPPFLRGQESHGRVRRLWSRRRDWKDLMPPPPQGILRDVPFPQSPITPVRVREGQGGGATIGPPLI